MGDGWKRDAGEWRKGRDENKYMKGESYTIHPEGLKLRLCVPTCRVIQLWLTHRKLGLVPANCHLSLQTICHKLT